MGGLLVEHALRTSESHSDIGLQQVEKQTCGIVFLGTPHQGSNLANPAYRVARVLKAARMRVNTANLEVLCRDSPVLNDLEDWFYKWLSRRRQRQALVHIASFVEDMAMAGDVMVNTWVLHVKPLLDNLS